MMCLYFALLFRKQAKLHTDKGTKNKMSYFAVQLFAEMYNPPYTQSVNQFIQLIFFYTSNPLINHGLRLDYKNTSVHKLKVPR